MVRVTVFVEGSNAVDSLHWCNVWTRRSDTMNLMALVLMCDFWDSNSKSKDLIGGICRFLFFGHVTDHHHRELFLLHSIPFLLSLSLTSIYNAPSIFPPLSSLLCVDDNIPYPSSIGDGLTWQL